MSNKIFTFDNSNEARDWLRANDGYILDEYGNKYFIDDDNQKIGKECWGMNDEGVWEIYDIIYYSDHEFIECFTDASDLHGYLHIR